MSKILKLIHRALSDSDMRSMLGADIKIIKYAELAGTADLNDLLPQPVDCCIILYEDHLNHGHWTCLSKYGGIFEHFDSYGMKPDSELRWTNLKMRQKLHEATPYLTHLLDEVHYIYNRMRYQALDAYVNTCGSHVAHRLYRLKHDGMDLSHYNQFMRSIREDTGESYDMIVAEFVRGFQLPPT